jgi:hypothetical protein
MTPSLEELFLYIEAHNHDLAQELDAEGSFYGACVVIAEHYQLPLPKPTDAISYTADRLLTGIKQQKDDLK